MRNTLALLLAVAALLVGDAGHARGKKRSGLLELHTMTEGAIVVVDGKEVGVTPLAEPLRFPVGRHTMKITKPGYTEFLDVFEIKPNDTTKVDVDLLPYAGVLIVTATVEGARVFIDGKFEGLTPLEKEVLIGRRSVRVTKAGYYDFIATFKAQAGKPKRVHARLRQLPLGSTPYRPKPLPPPKWYEKWYVWGGIAGGVVAVTLAIVLPVTLRKGDEITGWNPDPGWRVLVGKPK
jgi:hypothetical protein